MEKEIQTIIPIYSKDLESLGFILKNMRIGVGCYVLDIGLHTLYVPIYEFFELKESLIVNHNLHSMRIEDLKVLKQLIKILKKV